MRTAITLAAWAGSVVLAAGAVEAQQRFQLERTEQGIVRLDTETGALTLCRDENGALTCRMAPDERAAYDTELDLLEKRVTALEERLSHMPPQQLPSDAEVDRSLSIMERFMRTFMGIVREFTGEPNPEPQPDRTGDGAADLQRETKAPLFRLTNEATNSIRP